MSISIETIAALIFLAPLFALMILALIGIFNYRSKENIIKKTVAITQTISLVASIILAVYLIILNNHSNKGVIALNLKIFSFEEHRFNFILLIDKLSIWFVVVATILANIVGVFSQNYLHNDKSFYRFFLLTTIFLNGILILFMGANFNVLFIGWELIGLASALLISFFNSRRQTVDNALHAFWSYRISDVGLIAAMILLSSHFTGFIFSDPETPRVLESDLGYIIPLLLFVSAMGKSAQYPFCSWLPKAMEGPTSSSAIFYGGLSIHAGVYLLLRSAAEFEFTFLANFMICVVGITSAFYGMLLSQVQSDVKSALGYASISQVGIMFVEIGFGLYNLALVHCIGHAFLRTYQILKSASIIQEFLDFEDIHGNQIANPKTSIFSMIIPKTVKNKLFSVAFNLSMNESFAPSRIVILLEKISFILEKIEAKWLGSIVKFRGRFKI